LRLRGPARREGTDAAERVHVVVEPHRFEGQGHAEGRRGRSVPRGRRGRRVDDRLRDGRRPRGRGDARRDPGVAMNLRALFPFAALAAASCGPSFVAGPPKFAEVPETSGFTFRHELPDGTLDNLMKSAMGGVALIDYDGDGKIDVFCVNGGWSDDPQLA